MGWGPRGGISEESSLSPRAQTCPCPLSSRPGSFPWLPPAGLGLCVTPRARRGLPASPCKLCASDRGHPWHSGKNAAFLKGSPTGKQELGCPAPRCAPGCPCRSAGSSEALLPAAPGQGGAAVASLLCAPTWAEVAPGAAGSRWTAGPGRREGAPWTRDVVVRVALQRTPNPAPSSCAPRSLVQSFIRSVHLLVWGTGATPGKETGHQQTSHRRDSGSGRSLEG